MNRRPEPGIGGERDMGQRDTGQPDTGRRRIGRRNVGQMVITAVVGLVLGTAYLQLLTLALEVVWTTVPQRLGNELLVAGYMVVMLTGGAVFVGLLRHRTGVFGHSPLDGLTVSVASLKVALTSLLLVVITLLSGAVLGPEAGLLALGTAVGVFVSERQPGSDTHRLVTIGAIGALLGLVVSLAWHSTLNLGGGYQFEWADLLAAAAVALLAAVCVAIVRLGAYAWRQWADPGETHANRVALSGLLIALVAISSYLVWDIDLHLILGSGEGHISDLLALTDGGVVAVIVLTKGLGYALSLGGGLRGGPIFPAMFLGGAVGVLASLAGLPGVPAVLAAAGILAATSVGLALHWIPLTVSGVALGLLLGGWALVPAAVLGVVIGRLVGTGLERVPGVGPVPDAPAVAATARRG